MHGPEIHEVAQLALHECRDHLTSGLDAKYPAIALVERVYSTAGSHPPKGLTTWAHCTCCVRIYLLFMFVTFPTTLTRVRHENSLERPPNRPGTAHGNNIDIRLSKTIRIGQVQYSIDEHAVNDFVSLR